MTAIIQYYLSIHANFENHRANIQIIHRQDGEEELNDMRFMIQVFRIIGVFVMFAIPARPGI